MTTPDRYQRITPDVQLGRDVRIYDFVNLYGCTIGDESKIGTFVEIQKKAHIGARCKISSHTFICEGVVIEDDWLRARPVFLTYLTLGILTAISVARYPHVVEWGSLAAWALVLAIASAMVLGGYGTMASRPSRFIAAPDRPGP